MHGNMPILKSPHHGFYNEKLGIGYYSWFSVSQARHFPVRILSDEFAIPEIQSTSQTNWLSRSHKCHKLI